MKRIRVGSRESRLAVIQSEKVIEKIKECCPEYEIELVTMKTTGDRILDKALDKIGGKGLFVKELDRALIEKEIDIAVHSLKDVPMETDENLPLIGYMKRENPFDVLVLPKGKNEIDFSLPIGSSSMRRNIQIKELYKDAETKAVRGNVITRLEKLDRGEFSALILAYAGLERLGLKKRIKRVFTKDEILPACGQGIIAIQGRKDEKFDFIEKINDFEAMVCAECERTFVRKLNGGCWLPTAAFAELEGEEITLTGFFAEGERKIKKSIKGKIDDRIRLGEMLAEKIRTDLRKH